MKKKTSLSSLTIILCLFLLFVSSANCRLLIPPPTSSRNTRHTHYCHSFPHTRPRSLCIDLQRMHHNLPPLPTPQANGVDLDLDPRYGAEKRRVPTGPNPLHN
ncbi:CLAVATA3/ESR (CLE)-related protein 9-like [Abrus precatorius]|uniref:CLAVATA3/ESR (CLE)-related protein 9-like n=1 Tax=Abrus precatorius TaxID=3816 RepID=A0A8B8KWN4_ABRPR|nr:CLAVATA3/ESR (CLE)-related protein 9-like [Abrus precatorius]